jgi:uncharacterized delta-60 repeat protein
MKRTIRIFAFLSLLLVMQLLLSTASWAQPTQEWIMRMNGYGNNDDQACCIALDPNENIIVSGYGNGVTTGRDFGTVMYHQAGIEQWYSDYYTPGSPWVEQVTAMVVDANGNIIVTGSTNGFGTGIDYYTIKYNPAGVQQWAARYNGPQNSGDTPHAIAVDNLGNIYVTGESVAPTTANDILTIKYNPNGDSLWTARFNVGADKGWDIAVDDEGSAYVVGEGAMGFVTLKYTAFGQLVWSRLIPTSTSSYHYGQVITVDLNHNVYVSGYSVLNGGPSYDYLTIMYDPAGNQVWQARYNGPTNKADYPTAIAVDSAGCVYVTGYSNSSTTTETKNDFATVKYDHNGAQLWAARYNGPADKSDNARAMAFDNQGCVYITGESNNPPTSDYDYATVCYNTTSGVEQWVIRYNSTTNGPDYATGIVVDSDRNIYVSGYSPGTNLMADWVTIKYSYGINHPNVTVGMTPLNPPIQIPASGGTFQYNINVHVLETTPQNVDVWIMMKKLPHGPWSGPFLNANRNFPGGANPTRTRNQNIAASLEAGTYLYQGRVGDYPNEIWNISDFEFTKLTAGDGPWVGDFDNYGENFDDLVMEQVTPTQCSLIGAYPNPFNPTTTISYQLPATGFINLSVYDISGKKVAELVNGNREAGAHEVTFDATDLASGVYLYKLETGNITMTNKMVVIK